MDKELTQLAELPEPEGVIGHLGGEYENDWMSSRDAYSEEQMQAYAIAAQAPLIERIKELEKQRDRLLEFIEQAPVSSGVCCCGDSIDKHPSPMTCGHTPIDQWDNAVSSLVREFEQDCALAPPQGQKGGV